MGELLEALHRLQEIELKLAEFRRAEESRRRRIDAGERRLKMVEQRLVESHTSIQESQMRIDSLTLDVDAREASINKHRDALSKARTNKEYAAILTAINTEKADNTKIETQILELMEHNKKFQDRGAEIEGEKETIHNRVLAAKKELEEYRARTDEERDRQQAQRDQFAEEIPPEALSTFTRVAQRHDGEAMVPIVKLHPKRAEYACSGCNMSLTLDVVNALAVGNELQFCRVCGRLLYPENQAAKSSR